MAFGSLIQKNGVSRLPLCSVNRTRFVAAHSRHRLSATGPARWNESRHSSLLQSSHPYCRWPSIDRLFWNHRHHGLLTSTFVRPSGMPNSLMRIA